MSFAGSRESLSVVSMVTIAMLMCTSLCKGYILLGTYDIETRIIKVDNRKRKTLFVLIV